MTVLFPESDYLDDFLFEDDPLLTQQVRASHKNRGGNGIISLSREGELLVAERDIILGQNIPDYTPWQIAPKNA